jgi:predicted transcriptional regulator
MPNQPYDPQPTDAELDILGVLWERGPSTVREVHSVLNKRRDTGYTTVLKFLQIMFEKRLVTRDESNRAHVYEAVASREATEKGLVETFVDKAFGGSASKLVLRALASRPASADELAEIRALIKKLEEENR